MSVLFMLVISLININQVYASQPAATFTYEFQIKDGSNWVHGTLGSFVGLSSGFSSDTIRYTNVALQPVDVTAGDTVVLSGVVMAMFDYSSVDVNVPLIFTCPQFIGNEIRTTDCQMSSSTDISGGQHFIVYTFTVTGYALSDYSQTYVELRTYLKNNFTSAIRFYSNSGVFSSSNVAGADLQSAIQSLNSSVQSFNLDYTSRFSTQIHAIQDFNSDVDRIGQSILDALSDLESSTNVTDAIDQTNDLLEQQQEQDQQDRDNLESQQEDAQDGADDSQVAAQSTGTTLLAAFTGFVGTLTSASPSNCVIDMDMGNMDLGNVDFCQMSPPPIFQTIASIMLIAFCVPLSIATATKVIELFRSFQS